MLTQPPASAARDIAFVAAVPISLSAFLAPHVRAISRRHGVTLVASSAPDMSCFDSAVTFAAVDIPRTISIGADLRALFALWRLFRRRGFRAVISITPKAGLLTMLAGRLARVPIRVHWFTGQVWATRRGFSRLMLKALDRLLAGCSTHLLADSVSQRDFLIHEGVVTPGHVTVLAEGSVCGVDISRFHPDAAARGAIRRELAIPESAVVALYLGRLSVEKGVIELAAAFASAARTVPALHLLFVGPDEGALRPRLEALLRDVPSRVRFAGPTAQPEAFMAAADFFVLPSYREGFGSTIIEAAACGLPSIASRIYGISDAVNDETGVLVPVGDIDALAAAIVAMTREGTAREAMGRRARARVEGQFAQPVLTAAFEAYLAQALAAARP